MFVPVPIDARCPTRLPVQQKKYTTSKKDHFVMSRQIDFHFCGFQQQSGNRLVTFCKSFRSISYIPGKCGSTVHLMCVCVCLCLLLLGRFLGARRWPCGFKMRLWDQIKSVFSAWKNQNNRTFLRSIKKYGLILNVLLVSAFSCVLVSKKQDDLRFFFFLFSFALFFSFCNKVPDPSAPTADVLPESFTSPWFQSLCICARGEFCPPRVGFPVFPCSHRFGYLLPRRVAECKR